MNVNMHSRNNQRICATARRLPYADGTSVALVRFTGEGDNEMNLFVHTVEELEHMVFELTALIMEIRIVEEQVDGE